MRCLVLGGTGALGQAVVHALAASGASVAFTYHQSPDTARGLEGALDTIKSLPVDLTSVANVEEAVDQAALHMGGLDALVQCAGVAVTVRSSDPRPAQTMDEIDEEAWDRMLDVNLKGTFFACRRAARIMRETGGGDIVLVGSADAVKPLPSPVHFACAKAALAGGVRAMAKELGPAGLRINLVAPGLIDGGISRALRQDLIDDYLKHCGLKRLAAPGEIASVIAWLALENTYVTGQTILLDGAL